MANAQIFAYLKQVIDDLGLPGDEPGLFERLKEASAHLENVMGQFIPVSGTRTFAAKYSGKLRIDPLISATAVVDDDCTLATDDYDLLPLNREWADGPYTYIQPDGGSGKFSDELVISGTWGKFSRLQALGINGTLAAAGTTSLAVTNGSILWPGLVLLMESEQMLVEAGCGGENSPDPTLATSKLGQALSDNEDDVLVDSGAEFYQGEVLRIDSEDVLIRRKAGNVCTVTRGWNNTTRANHVMDSAIYVYRTVTLQRGVNGTTAAAHNNVAISRYVAPEDVNYLTRQICALMRGKAMTGFTGRAGNSEAGESFWINEFPAAKIEAVALHYKIW